MVKFSLVSAVKFVCAMIQCTTLTEVTGFFFLSLLKKSEIPRSKSQECYARELAVRRSLSRWRSPSGLPTSTFRRPCHLRQGFFFFSLLKKSQIPRSKSQECYVRELAVRRSLSRWRSPSGLPTSTFRRPCHLRQGFFFFSLLKKSQIPRSKSQECYVRELAVRRSLSRWRSPSGLPTSPHFEALAKKCPNTEALDTSVKHQIPNPKSQAPNSRSGLGRVPFTLYRYAVKRSFRTATFLLGFEGNSKPRSRIPSTKFQVWRW